MTGERVVLREWRMRDLPTMVALFDTEEMDRWTPLAAPFDLAEAKVYLDAASRLRAHDGTAQLAITADGDAPMGEVLAFPGGTPGTVELAYAVGAPFQGQGIARQAVTAMLLALGGPAADAWPTGRTGVGLSRARLVITTDNVRSEAVAAGCGFTRADEPTTERRRKGGC